MERVWALAYMKGSNDIAFGYDEGIIAIKVSILIFFEVT